MTCILSPKLTKSNFKFIKNTKCNSKSGENNFMFIENVSNVLCHSESLNSRQGECKMLRMQFQLKIQIHKDSLLERPVGIVWAENGQQMTQEENICALF